MPKLNGIEFLEPVGESIITTNTKRIAHSINFGIYVNNKAELFIHDIESKLVRQFKTSKDINKQATIYSLIDTYKLIYK